MISGRYILQPEIFTLLEQQGPGAGGEIQLTDAMLALLKTTPFHALPFDGRTYDTGSKLGYLEAVAAYALADRTDGEAAAALLRETLDRLG